VAEETHASCFLCARENLFDDRARDQPITCLTCGAAFLPPPAKGEASRPLPLHGSNATSDEWEGIDGWLGEVFCARQAAANLHMGEARQIANALHTVRGWEPEPGQLHIPLTMDVAEPLAGSLLFSGQPFTIDPTDSGVELVFVISTSGGKKAASGLGGMLLFNLVGTLSLATVGVGVFRRGGDDGDPGIRNQHRLRLGIMPSSSGKGVDLSLSTQLNADAPKPAPAKALRQLSKVVAKKKGVLEAYLSVLGIFGSTAVGAKAFSVTPDAIRNRFRALGVKAETPALEALCPSRVAAATG
jgi:hypothetical protein